MSSSSARNTLLDRSLLARTSASPTLLTRGRLAILKVIGLADLSELDEASRSGALW